MNKQILAKIAVSTILVAGSMDALAQQPVFRMPLPIDTTSQCVQGTLTTTASHNVPLTQHALDFDTPNDGAAEPVVAAAAGAAYAFGGCSVGDATCNHGFGNHVKIDHGDGIYSIYAHLASISVVNGSPVSTGDVIGTEGLTGNTQGDHVHFAVHSGDATVLLPGPSVPIAQLEVVDTTPPDVPSGRGYKVISGNEVVCGLASAGEPPGHVYRSTNVDQSSKVDVTMIIDSSGSMQVNDAGDKRLQAARAYLSASISGDYVGVIDFDHTVRIASPLAPVSSDLESLRQAVDTIDASGGTNIGLGVQTGCDQLDSSGSGNLVRAAILLTDGFGAFNNEDYCFREEGWRIFTFGIGNADTILLDRLAMDTGGEFRDLSTTSLICEFQRIRARVVGADPGSCTSYDIVQGQSIFATVTVPAGQGSASFTSSWIGSDVVMTLTSPSGRVIDRYSTGPDITKDNGASFEVISVTDPEAGDWSIELFGADIPPEGEEVVFGFTSIPKPVLTVAIDIKPGSTSNSINPRSKGKIPVAIITTDIFDASGVDPAGVVFGSSGTSAAHPNGHLEDVDGDGDTDMVLHFETAETGITCGDTMAQLTGSTFDGQAIEGGDALETVGCKK